MAADDDSRNDVLLVERDGPVVVITLNRPDALNSFDWDLHHAFSSFWLSVEADLSIRAVVVTGAGRAFSAGGNTDDFELFRIDQDERNRIIRSSRRLVDEMLNVRVPVVAAVNGHAIGLGCTLATLCDIVVMSEDARIADPHVQVALVAGDGGAVTWPHLMGMLKAKQYLLTGDPIPAADAVELGLANFVVPAGEVLGAAVAFAQKLAALPPQAVQDTKAILNQHLRASALWTLGYGLAAETHSHDTPAYAETSRGFQERKQRG